MSLDLDPRLIDALLSWQAELGADEYIGDGPVDRFAESAAEAARRAASQGAAAVGPDPAGGAEGRSRRPAPPPPPPEPPRVDPVAEARLAARGCDSLEALAEALRSYPHCDLRRGARNLVFAEGPATAPVMLIGEAPDRDEDKQGRPFAGRAGALLELMLHAIGLDRDSPDPDKAVHLVPLLPWSPPGGREPSAEELAMLQPFLLRHIELVNPRVLVLLGNQPCQALLGQGGISGLRGQWTEFRGRPTLPMQHPGYLLRNPAAKRQAWADLLSLQARMRQP